MSSTSTIRMWDPTLKYFSSGFHILIMFSSSLTYDLILGTLKNFNIPHMRRESKVLASFPALISSSSCSLSFQITILLKAAFQNIKMDYQNINTTIKNTSTSSFCSIFATFQENLRDHPFSCYDREVPLHFSIEKNIVSPRHHLYPKRKESYLVNAFSPQRNDQKTLKHA